MSGEFEIIQADELAAAEAYFRANGRTYWDDLVEAERTEGRRFLGRRGRISWLANFAPFGVAGDVVAVVDDCRAMLDLTEADVDGIARGLAAAMAAYDRMGIYSFNVCFFPGTESRFSAGKNLSIGKAIFLNDEDCAALKALSAAGIKIEGRGVPSDRPLDDPGLRPRLRPPREVAPPCTARRGPARTGPRRARNPGARVR